MRESRLVLESVITTRPGFDLLLMIEDCLKNRTISLM